MKSRRTRLAVVVLAVLSLVFSSGCTRVERVNVEGVDCVVAKSGKSVRALDCNWPNEDDTSPRNEADTDSPQ